MTVNTPNRVISREGEEFQTIINSIHTGLYVASEVGWCCGGYWTLNVTAADFQTEFMVVWFCLTNNECSVALSCRFQHDPSSIFLHSL